MPCRPTRVSLLLLACSLAPLPLPSAAPASLAQSPPPAQSPNLSSPDLDALAQEIAKALREAHAKKFLITDFSGPKKDVTVLGVTLSDELSAALRFTAPDLTTLPRDGLVMSLRPAPLEPPSPDPHRFILEALARRVGANGLVTGFFKTEKSLIHLTIEVWTVRVLSLTSPNDAQKSAQIYHTSINLRRIPLWNDFARMTLPLPERNSLRVSAGLGRTPPPTVSLSDASDAAQNLPSSAATPGRNGIGYPQCQSCPPPSYTALAREKKVEGTVLLQIVITPEGRATDIRIVKRLGFGLDEMAIAAVQNWRFEPARGPDGKPVAVIVPVEVNFRLLK